MQVVLLRKAQEDIRKGAAFYAKQSGEAAVYFVETINRRLRQLETSGGVHMRVYGFHRMLATPFPFAIYYAVVKDTILVHAVIDCRRLPFFIWAHLR